MSLMSQHAIQTVTVGYLHARIQTRCVAAAIEHCIQRGKKLCYTKKQWRERESDLTICSLFLKDQDVTIGSGNVRLWLPPQICFLSSEGIYSKARGSVRLRARNFTPCFESKTCCWAAGCYTMGCSASRQDSGYQGATRSM